MGNLVKMTIFAYACFVIKRLPINEKDTVLRHYSWC